jgi:hypothetical protein
MLRGNPNVLALCTTAGRAVGASIGPDTPSPSSPSGPSNRASLQGAGFATTKTSGLYFTQDRPISVRHHLVLEINQLGNREVLEISRNWKSSTTGNHQL